VIVACTPAAIAAGVTSNDVMGTVTARMGGRGGGKDDMAQGGGGDPAQVDAAFADVTASLAQR